MYEFFGRLCEYSVWWYRPMRRIVRNNRRDMGKMVVHCIVADVIIYGGLWLWLRRSNKSDTIDAEIKDFPFNDGEYDGLVTVNDDTFLKRFGVLARGDTVTIKLNDEHIDCEFRRYTDDGKLVLIASTQGAEFTVHKMDVLDVTPAF